MDRRARVAIANMRACHARSKSLLNIQNVARQDALNASLYNLDRNQSTLSRHVQNILRHILVQCSFHSIQTSTDRSLLGLIYSMDCFKKVSGPSIIVNSRFLERPQKRCLRNQLIHKRLIKTKIDRPIQTVRCLELRRGGRYQDRILGYWVLYPKWKSMAFVRIVCLRPRLGVLCKFCRPSWHAYIGRTLHYNTIGKIHDICHRASAISLVTKYAPMN